MPPFWLLLCWMSSYWLLWCCMPPYLRLLYWISPYRLLLCLMSLYWLFLCWMTSYWTFYAESHHTDLYAGHHTDYFYAECHHVVLLKVVAPPILLDNTFFSLSFPYYPWILSYSERTLPQDSQKQGRALNVRLVCCYKWPWKFEMS